MRSLPTNNRNPRSAARAPGGFTLLELLVVITILMMLMMLLLPAILKARLLVLGILEGGQVTSLSNACNAYQDTYNAYPTVVENPPTSGGSPAKLSGSQCLRLALLGCQKDGNKFVPMYQGPSDDMTRYDDSTIRKYEPFYSPKPEGLQRHGDVYGKQGGDGYCDDIEVFVAYYLTPARPFLYYRKLPRYVNTALFEYNDCEVYCDADKGENDQTWAAVLTGDAKKSLEFLIVAPGVDRLYFTGDDKSNIPN